MANDDKNTQTRADVLINLAALHEVENDVNGVYDSENPVLSDELFPLIIEGLASPEGIPARAETSEFYRTFENEFKEMHGALDRVVDQNDAR